MDTRLIGSLLMLTVVAAHAQTQAPSIVAPSGKTELAPETRTAIRGVGQSILGVRRGYVSDPALSATRSELAALQATLETLSNPNPGAAIKLQNQQATLSATAPLSSADQEKGSQVLRGHLERLHTHRAELEARAHDKNANETTRSIAQSSANKLVELERDIDDAQQATGEDRAQRLAHLRERLMPQSHLSMTDPATETHTPTMTTIVAHRR